MKRESHDLYAGDEGEQTIIRSYNFKFRYLELIKECFSGDSFRLHICCPYGINEKNLYDVFPLVIKMREESGTYLLHDDYLFGTDGNCIYHEYSVWEKGKPQVLRENDIDVDRLIVKGSLIKKLLDIRNIPIELSRHPTFKSLRENSW